MGLDNKPNAPGKILYLYLEFNIYIASKFRGQFEKKICLETLHVVFSMGAPIAYPPCIVRQNEMKFILGHAW
jgi:hypothetical protein